MILQRVHEVQHYQFQKKKGGGVHEVHNNILVIQMAIHQLLGIQLVDICSLPMLFLLLI